MSRRVFAVLLTLALALCTLAASASAQPVYRGKLEIRHSDDFRHARGQTTWTLVHAGRRTPILPDGAPRASSGDRVTVRGRKHGKFIEGTVRRRPGGKVHAATVLGTHSLAVVLINFATDTRQPWTPSYVNQRIFTDPDSTAAFYDEESFGNINVTGSVYGWYTIAGPTAGCDVDAWASQARSAAAADHVDLSAYDHVMYVFPQQSSCGGWAGLGEMPGQQTWLNGDISVRVAAHELGHNMGLHHASSYSCTQGGTQVTMSSSCTASEYGDPFDVMGLNARHSNAWHLEQLGVIQGANVQTVSASGTYALRSALTPGTGTMLLRVPAGGNPAYWYDLEIRQSGGVFDNFTSTSPVVNGVSVHYDPSPSTITQSLLLDGNPGVGGFTDSALGQGRTFSDGHVSITATSVGNGTATVSVVLGVVPDVTAPSAPTGLTARPSDNRVDLSWGASSDDVGVTGYRVYRDGLLIATTTATTYADTGLAAGSTHGYQVAAFDAAGNAATSGALYATVPSPPPPPTTSVQPRADHAAPVVRVVSPGNRARLRRSATIKATATDDTRVSRVELSIDGRTVSIVRASRIVRRWSLRGVRPGTHTIRVRAFDASGNAASKVVRVRVVTSRS